MAGVDAAAVGGGAVSAGAEGSEAAVGGGEARAEAVESAESAEAAESADDGTEPVVGSGADQPAAEDPPPTAADDPPPTTDKTKNLPQLTVDVDPPNTDNKRPATADPRARADPGSRQRPNTAPVNREAHRAREKPKQVHRVRQIHGREAHRTKEQLFRMRHEYNQLRDATRRKRRELAAMELQVTDLRSQSRHWAAEAGRVKHHEGEGNFRRDLVAELGAQAEEEEAQHRILRHMHATRREEADRQASANRLLAAAGEELRASIQPVEVAARQQQNLVAVAEAELARERALAAQEAREHETALGVLNNELGEIDRLLQLRESADARRRDIVDQEQRRAAVDPRATRREVVQTLREGTARGALREHEARAGELREQLAPLLRATGASSVGAVLRKAQAHPDTMRSLQATVDAEAARVARLRAERDALRSDLEDLRVSGLSNIAKVRSQLDRVQEQLERASADREYWEARQTEAGRVVASVVAGAEALGARVGGVLAALGSPLAAAELPRATPAALPELLDALRLRLNGVRGALGGSPRTTVPPEALAKAVPPSPASQLAHRRPSSPTPVELFPGSNASSSESPERALAKRETASIMHHATRRERELRREMATRLPGFDVAEPPQEEVEAALKSEMKLYLADRHADGGGVSTGAAR